MPLVLNPPPTPVEPVTEVLHGVPITDPYRWLEDQNSPRTRKWLEEQTAYTRAYLDAIPGRERIRKRVEELLAVEVVTEPWKIGSRYFFLKRTPYQEQPMIMMREGDAGEDVPLVDPINRDATATTAVSILAVSHKGDVLAYRITYGGNPFHTTEFFDVSRNRILADRLPLGYIYGLVFSSDGRGFYYSPQFDNSSRPTYRAVYWHEFGIPSDKDLEVFFGGEDEHLRLELFGSTDGRLLGYLVVRNCDPQTYSLYVQDISSGKPARKILEQTGSIFWPCIVGSRLFALTDWGAPNLKVVTFDLSKLLDGQWFDVVPESRQRTTDFCIASNLVCITRVENGTSRIEVFEQSGRQLNAVVSPSVGTVHVFRRPIESDTLFYLFSSFTQPTTLYSWHPASGQQNRWTKTHTLFDPFTFKVEQARYKSKDGTEIPISLVGSGRSQSYRPQPAFLTGYGGFGSSRTPRFNVYSTFLIEKGFLFAVANLRGGGEFGAEWHDAGKRHNRQNVFDDFIAAAEWLVAEDFTTPEKLAIGGMSNGGLLVGAALTQRPDLFRAVVCVGPLLDMLRYHLFDGNFDKSEYGHPENAKDFSHLLAYSPYHRVKNDLFYPSVLIVSGDLDKTCDPMHARKMAARLQAASNSGHPTLLDYKDTWGHRSTQSLSRRIEAITDRLAFICHELCVGV